MGGIIAALIGIALIIGGVILSRKMAQASRQLEDRATTLAGRAEASRDSYDLRALADKAGNLRAEAKFGRWVSRGSWLLVLGGLVVVVASVLVIVPTRNVAVTDAFGRPTSTLGNGPHLTWPWESATVYDATVQTLDMSGDGKDGKPEQKVRIINGTAAATMNVIVEWRVDPNTDIKGLHQDWRSFEAIQDRVVKPRLAASLNSVFESYDPLIALRQAEGKPVSLGSMESRVKQDLQAAMPAGIIIRTVMLPYVQYPPAVQAALDDMQKELAATQVAIQQKLTAVEQRLAIEELQKVKMTPEAFLQQCLIVTERLAQQGKKISEAWTCTGNGVPITVTAK